MPFPTNPTPGQTHTEDNTTWVYAGPVNGWYRRSVSPGNSSDFRSGKGYVGSDLDVNGDIVLDDGGTYTTTLQTITPLANRTISLPNATGTVALVAGSSGQLVYNNAGAQAGAPGSVVGATGDVTLGLNGAASTPPLELTGTWFTGGTSTTTKPQVLIEPAGTTSTAWSTSGTGLGVNATSGFTGRLLDLQLNGTSRAFVDASGNVNIGSGNAVIWALNPATNYIKLYNTGTNGVDFSSSSSFTFFGGGTERARIDSSGRLLVGTTSSAGAPSSGSVVQLSDQFSVRAVNGGGTTNRYVITASATTISCVIDVPTSNNIFSSFIGSLYVCQQLTDSSKSFLAEYRVKLYNSGGTAVFTLVDSLDDSSPNNVALTFAYSNSNRQITVTSTWTTATSSTLVCTLIGAGASV